MSSAYGRPISIHGDEARLLDAVPLQAVDSGRYSEEWLQRLIYRYPQSLPVSEIESTFAPLIPVCLELPTPSGGYVDILFVTPQGRFAVVEVKLWRNPQARREVIGQILDYAKDLSTWSYEGIDAAIRSARRVEGYPEGALGLFEVALAASPGLDERQFIDGVSLSLQRGDFLLLIVGDGIRQGVSAIAEFLEGHGSLHFTFGIVEIPVFKDGSDRFLLQPRVQAQSLIVRRTVLTVDSSGVGIVQRDAELEEASIEGDVDPALAESRRHFFEFWSEFLADWQLDDQRQPLPKASRTTNLYFTMPSGSKSWISAYVAKSKSRVGVYLTFERGPVAETIYAALLGQRAEIEKVVGNELEWEDEGKGKYFILCRKIFPDVSDSRYRAEIIAWLRDISNKFITTFRPRIEAILKESVPAG